MKAHSSRCISRGWLDVGDRRIDNEGAIDLSRGITQGTRIEVKKLALDSKLTAPPGHLTESELLELMDEHKIGTDASMATHVSNVQNRNYVDLDTSTRQMIPSALGLALVNAYSLIDEGLVLPTVRSGIENACSLIARG